MLPLNFCSEQSVCYVICLGLVCIFPPSNCSVGAGNFQGLALFQVFRGHFEGFQGTLLRVGAL